MDLVARLEGLLRNDPWMMRILGAVQKCDIPDGYVSGGVIRNIVWDHLHGYRTLSELPDVDVIYYDPECLDGSQQKIHRDALAEAMPEVRWDVANQATVHLWYEDRYNFPLQPLISISDALTTWLETMTAVAVRLTNDDEMEIVAPFGLGDLFGMVVRRNSRQVTDVFYREHLRKKQYTHRWPNAIVLDEANK